MFAISACVPVEWTCVVVNVFTAACVATGISAGVSMIPCGVSRMPLRALLAEDL